MLTRCGSPNESTASLAIVCRPSGAEHQRAPSRFLLAPGVSGESDRRAVPWRPRVGASFTLARRCNMRRLIVLLGCVVVLSNLAGPTPGQEKKGKTHKVLM